MKNLPKIMFFIFLFLSLFFENIFAMDVPSLPITYNGNTYSQAIRYYSESGGEHTCYFEDGSVVAGYLPGSFWISHSRRYDPEGICGGTYETSGQLAVHFGANNVDCPADQNIFSSIPLTVPSGWGSSYQQCNYTYEIGDPFPAPAQSIASVVLSPAVGGVATLPQGDGVWCGIDGHYVCQVSFDQNSEITFEAYPYGEYTFAHWDDGVNQITENPHTFTMDISKTIIAVFETENSSLIVPPSLPVTFHNPLNWDGTVVQGDFTFNAAYAYVDTEDIQHTCYFKDPTFNSYTYPNGYIGINCDYYYTPDGGSCGTYLGYCGPGCVGGLLILQGVKSPIEENFYWSDNNLYTKSWWSYPWTLDSYEFTGADQQIYPFVQSPPLTTLLLVSNSPELGGGVTITPPLGFPYYHCGVNGGTTCELDLDYNAQVTLEAQHNEGYAFSHWEINSQTMGDTDGTIVVPMSEDKEVVAVFYLDMKLPLNSGKNWLLYVEPGGEVQCSGGTDPYHTGASYYSLDFSDDTLEDGHLESTDVPIRAALGGFVDFAGGDPNDNGWGYNVVIDHGYGYKTRYAHLKNEPTVSGTVIQGQTIGIMGNTGNSTGIHLHFQVYYDGDSSATNEGLAFVHLNGHPLNYYQVGCSSDNPPTGFYYSSNSQ